MELWLSQEFSFPHHAARLRAAWPQNLIWAQGIWSQPVYARTLRRFSRVDVPLGLVQRFQRQWRWFELVSHGSGDDGRRHCQTKWAGPAEPSIEDLYAASCRHSARAAARSCLKMSRRLRWRWWLKWLWIEAWTEANFCRVLISLNRTIAPSRLRKG